MITVSNDAFAPLVSAVGVIVSLDIPEDKKTVLLRAIKARFPPYMLQGAEYAALGEAIDYLISTDSVGSGPDGTADNRVVRKASPGTEAPEEAPKKRGRPRKVDG